MWQFDASCVSRHRVVWRPSSLIFHFFPFLHAGQIPQCFVRTFFFFFFLPSYFSSSCFALSYSFSSFLVPRAPIRVQRAPWSQRRCMRTFPPSLPHESSPFRCCCACCPFCRCRSASADSGCPLVHALRCSTTVAWHSSDGCATSYFTQPPVRPSTPVALRKSDALTLREVRSANSSCSTCQLPRHPAV